MPAENPTLAASRRWRRDLAVAVSLLIAGAGFSAVSSSLIASRFAGRPTPDDLLFRALPYVGWTQYVTDIALLVSLATLVIYAVRRERGRIPQMMAVFGGMYVVRAAIMLLTPLASASGNDVHYGLLPWIQNGMFPSGHTAAAALCVLLVDGGRGPLAKRVTVACLLAEVASLLLSRGHYSIDIVGGLLLAYFVHAEITRRGWLTGATFRSNS